MSKFSNQKTYALFSNLANTKIISELQKIGAETILFPTVEPEPLSTEKTEIILTNLNEFDWLIFPDIYTVEFFLQKLKEYIVELFELDVLQVCAYGESVADRLRYSQLHADIITNSIKNAEVFQSLKDFIFDENEFANLRFLVLKEENTKIEIVEELQKLKSEVVELPIYQTKPLETSKLTKLKTLLKGGAIDEFIFTSPSDVINLAHLFQTENLAEALSDVELSAVDNATKQALQEFRLI